MLLGYRWQISCLLQSAGRVWITSPCQGWEKQGRKRQSTECLPGYASQERKYFTPDGKAQKQAWIPSAPLLLGCDERMVWFSTQGALEMGPFPQPGCCVKSRLVLPEDLICTRVSFLRGSYKTEWTPFFGIKLDFIRLGWFWPDQGDYS